MPEAIKLPQVLVTCLE